MPPKVSKKTEQKKKDKIIEDKTFGLKNKKGAKQQKYIQQIEKQVKYGGNKSNRLIDKEKEDKNKKKEEKKKELAEINKLFKPVQQMVEKGVDPKSVLCAYFKQGTCAKGAKCKFSHDLNIGRKSEKRSAFVDTRNQDETSENWDKDKLTDVIEKKHGAETNKPITTIICKHFLEAVEEGKYGWFWQCPNGGEKCIYRHALPPGYILKKDRKSMEKQVEEISLEELIERDRAALGHDTTKVTLETFLAWKKKKLKERKEKEKKDKEKKKKDFKSGKDGGLSGREMFTFNPDLAEGGFEMEEGDAHFDLNNLEKDPEEEETEMEIHYKEIDLNALVTEYVNETAAEITKARADRLQNSNEGAVGGAASLPSPTQNGGEETVAIDEDLFGGDEEDLEELEEELEDLALT